MKRTGILCPFCTARVNNGLCIKCGHQDPKFVLDSDSSKELSMNEDGIYLVLDEEGKGHLESIKVDKEKKSKSLEEADIGTKEEDNYSLSEAEERLSDELNSASVFDASSMTNMEI